MAESGIIWRLLTPTSATWVAITQILGSAGAVDWSIYIWPLHVASVSSSRAAELKKSTQKWVSKELSKKAGWKREELFWTILRSHTVSLLHIMATSKSLWPLQIRGDRNWTPPLEDIITRTQQKMWEMLLQSSLGNPVCRRELYSMFQLHITRK